NESQSITYQQWKNAVDNNIETIPGTVYKNTNTDEVVESSQNIPYNTRYVSDETVEAGVRKIITQGENGTKNIITTYKRHNGVHTGKFTTQRIKEVGILPHTGEKSTSAIATAGAVILTTALGMLGFAKRKENNF
ncbi:MAG: G5 domain-containing protein, partial [Streptococcus sp.]|nr:G5 domain-containing protein [Streptococcus sp.]